MQQRPQELILGLNLVARARRKSTETCLDKGREQPSVIRRILFVAIWRHKRPCRIRPTSRQRRPLPQPNHPHALSFNMIAPITGKLRKRFWLDLSCAMGLGVSAGYAFW